MTTRIQPAASRSPRRLARLAAAVTLLAARSAAAEPSIDPGPIPPKPPTHRIQTSYQTWIGATAQGPIAGPVSVSADLVGGFDEAMRPAAVILSPAVRVKLPLGFSAAAGYSHLSLWDAEGRPVEEHLAFQYVAYQAPFTDVTLYGRVRAEERFRAGSDAGFRVRTLAQLVVPLWHKAPVDLVFSEELFLGLNQTARFQPEVLDLDLFYAAVGWSPSPHFRAEVGYQGAVVPRRDVTEIGHSLSISTTASW